MTKGAIETSTGGISFYSNIFIVPKHTDGLQAILSLKQFNCYVHISTYKMPTIRQVWQLIQQVEYAFSIDLKMLIYIFLLLSIHITFICCLATQNLTLEGFVIWAGYST